MQSRITVFLAAGSLLAGCADLDSDDPADGGADVGELCGNGVVDEGEYCDDGKKNGKYGHCKEWCLAMGPYCGDLIVNGPEICDDGNDISGDGCSVDCLSKDKCGNGVVEKDEVCDDGNTDDCEGDCLADCSGPITITGCGDGHVCGDEVCDDGNTDDCEGDCLADCSGPITITGCGDGYVCGDEVCDGGNTEGAPSNCSEDCSGLISGDGVFEGMITHEGAAFEGVEVCLRMSYIYVVRVNVIYTDIDGRYVAPGPEIWAGTDPYDRFSITPRKVGYRFDPARYDYWSGNIPSSVTDADFVAEKITTPRHAKGKWKAVAVEGTADEEDVLGRIYTFEDGCLSEFHVENTINCVDGLDYTAGNPECVGYGPPGHFHGLGYGGAYDKATGQWQVTKRMWIVVPPGTTYETNTTLTLERAE